MQYPEVERKLKLNFSSGVGFKLKNKLNHTSVSTDEKTTRVNNMVNVIYKTQKSVPNRKEFLKKWPATHQILYHNYV
jgi:hypothetical protein